MGIAPTTIRTIFTRDAKKITQSLSNVGSKYKKKHKVFLELDYWKDGITVTDMDWGQKSAESGFESKYNFVQSKKSFSRLEESGNNTETFEASRGWFQRFKERSELHNIALKGEGASADHAGAKAFQETFEKNVLEDGYSLQQLINVDKTGLCWKKMHNRTFISKAEKSASGHKIAKERLTLLLGGNAQGDFKFKPFLIYISENPSAMKNYNKKSLRVHWRSKNKAWMNVLRLGKKIFFL